MKAITLVGGKTRTGADGTMAKGWDHDPPAARQWTPLGILMLATNALTIIFGNRETSDFWVDGLKLWWLQVGGSLTSIRRVVIYSRGVRRLRVRLTMRRRFARSPSLARPANNA